MFVESLRILVRAEERMGKALHRSADKSRHLYFKKGGGEGGWRGRAPPQCHRSFNFFGRFSGKAQAEIGRPQKHSKADCTGSVIWRGRLGCAWWARTGAIHRSCAAVHTLPAVACVQDGHG